MPDLTGFDDVRFPVTISLGAVGGEEILTTIQVTGAGYEYRNADWEEMRGRWNVENRNIDRVDAEAIAAFFRARLGPTRSFRWKSWDDYTAVNNYFGTGNGLNDTFPLYKTYADAVNATQRRIVLPCNPAVYTTEIQFVIYVDGIFQTTNKYTVDWRNGIITFDPLYIPANGAILRWDGEFDVPARFGMGHLRKRMYTEDIISFNEVTIVEIRPEEVIYIAGSSV